MASVADSGLDRCDPHDVARTATALALYAAVSVLECQKLMDGADSR